MTTITKAVAIIIGLEIEVKKAGLAVNDSHIAGSMSCLLERITSTDKATREAAKERIKALANVGGWVSD